MRSRDGGRPRKSWMSCAAFWTSTRGEGDEQLRELDFAGASADARLDVVALPMARGGAGGSVCRGGRGLPKRAGALRAGGGRARFGEDMAGRHLHLGVTSMQIGRLGRCRKSFVIGREL